MPPLSTVALCKALCKLRDGDASDDDLNILSLQCGVLTRKGIQKDAAQLAKLLRSIPDDPRCMGPWIPQSKLPTTPRALGVQIAKHICNFAVCFYDTLRCLRYLPREVKTGGNVDNGNNAVVLVVYVLPVFTSPGR